jgi:hypothetical protein
MGEISDADLHTAAAIIQQLDAVLGVIREKCGNL